MLSYRHGFHAGNFADVFKHLLLHHVLQALTEKPTPFCYLETHAGAGQYHLQSAQSQQTQEADQGIRRLWRRPDIPKAVLSYRQTVAAFNPGKNLTLYPGSPRIAQHLLRAQDRMILCERHPAELPRLQKVFADDRRVQVQDMDGYQGLRASLPALQKRGLVFIDPAYENDREYRQVAEALARIHPHWRQGRFVIWYPLLQRHGGQRFRHSLAGTGFKDSLAVELQVRQPHSGPGMWGCGMALINPPWRLQEQLEAVLPWLVSVLEEPGQGQARLLPLD